MHIVHADNISIAWAKAVLRAGQHRGELTPLVVKITGFDDVGNPNEDSVIRARLDKALVARGKQSVNTVAGTIFPASQWNPKQPRKLLFERYRRTLPGLKRHPKNRLGLYFERLTEGAALGGQLDFIIKAFGRKGMRRSVLQASIFDPKRDLTLSAQKGFPCLQHVSFVKHRGGLLNVNAFYALQYLVERGYGNYLGLARLGAFMAHELGLKLNAVNVFVGIAQRDGALLAPALKKIVAGVDDDEDGDER